MNEEFEKILEMLEEKLRKSEERYYRYLDDSNLSCMFDRSDIEEIRVDTIKEMLEIVQEVAEEYNNGWITCSDRLPEEHKLYDITFRNDAGIHSDSAIYNPFLKRWLWDSDETELVENEVLAWAEKREPYKEEDAYFHVGDVVTDGGYHGEVVITIIHGEFFSGYYRSDGVTVSGLKKEKFKKTGMHIDIHIKKD